LAVISNVTPDFLKKQGRKYYYSEFGSSCLNKKWRISWNFEWFPDFSSSFLVCFSQKVHFIPPWIDGWQLWQLIHTEPCAKLTAQRQNCQISLCGSKKW